MKIHTFPDSETAGDSAGVDADVQIGDVLVVESEKVVGVNAVYPFAVTVASGELDSFGIDVPIVDPKVLLRLVCSIRAAIAEARRLGYEVNPDFAGFESDCP